MQANTFNYFALFFTTFLIVAFLTPLARKFALHNGIVDSPNQAHKTHKEPVPYLGGVAIFLGIILVSYGTAIYKNFSEKNFNLLTSVMAPALVLGLIGLWDDIRNISPLFRFVIQSIAGVFTAWILTSNETAGNPTGSGALDALISFL